jgi:uncharacterized protein YuzE
VKFGYDAETVTLRIVLSSAPIAESDEDKPGVIIDYDAEGNIVGIEVLQASKRTDNPTRMELLPV